MNTSPLFILPKNLREDKLVVVSSICLSGTLSSFINTASKIDTVMHKQLPCDQCDQLIAGQQRQMTIIIYNSVL